jgi:hypothetical protein
MKILIIANGELSFRFAKTFENQEEKQIFLTCEKEKGITFSDNIVFLPFDKIDFSQAFDVVIIGLPPIGEQLDPVLSFYKEQIKAHPPKQLIYLSSWYVYLNHSDEWVKETSICRPEDADGQVYLKTEKLWKSIFSGVVVLRLGQIYAPKKAIVDKILDGTAQRTCQSAQTSRFHVDDLIAIIMKIIDQKIEGEIFNIADDMPCPSDEVVEFACDLMGVPYPCNSFADSAMPLDCKGIPKMLNAKVKRKLSYKFLYPSYKEGISSIVKEKNIQLVGTQEPKETNFLKRLFRFFVRKK